MKTNYNNLIDRLLNDLNDLQDDIYYCNDFRKLKKLQRKEKHILKILDKEFNIKLKSVF
jgi:hypothetical protein